MERLLIGLHGDSSRSPSHPSLYEYPGSMPDTAWVQENARWHVFPSSQFSQLNSPKRNTLETTFFFLKLPLKFSNQRRKSKRHVPGKNRGRTAARPPWAGRTRPVGPPCFAARFGLVFCVPPLFGIFSP
jgi:hypothetical protein